MRLTLFSLTCGLSAAVSQRPHIEGVVDVQIFYKIDCPHCAEFMKRGVSELVNAKVPGSSGVRITILPLIKPPHGQQGCLGDRLCASALPSLCALKRLMPEPVPSDHALLPETVKFLSCDLDHTAGRGGSTPLSVKACALQSGFDPEDLDRCTSGDEIFHTMFSEDYGGHIMSAIRILQEAGFPDHISMPWTFLDGRLLQCSGEECTGTIHPEGTSPLKDPGSLLYLVCARLNPRPAACKNVHGFVGRPVVAQVRACENCAEAVALRQALPREQAFARSPWLAALAASAAIVASCAGAFAHYGWRCSCCRQQASSPIVVHLACVE